MTLQSLSISSVVVAAPEQISSDLMGEAVILDLKQGIYHGLDPTGARIWSLLQERKSLSNVRDTILKEYDVDADRCERDVLRLAQQLLDKGLIQICDG